MSSSFTPRRTRRECRTERMSSPRMNFSVPTSGSRRRSYVSVTVPKTLFSCGKSPNGVSGETALNTSAKSTFQFRVDEDTEPSTCDSWLRHILYARSEPVLCALLRQQGYADPRSLITMRLRTAYECEPNGPKKASFGRGSSDMKGRYKDRYHRGGRRGEPGVHFTDASEPRYHIYWPPCVWYVGVCH